jgi:hypothetical protein
MLNSKLGFLAFLSYILLSVGCVFVSTQVFAGLGTPVFTEKFDSGDLSRWTVSPMGLAQNWSVVNGRAQYNGGGHTQIYSGEATWRNYQIQTTFQVSACCDFPGGIRGRIDANTGRAYAAWVYPSQNKIELWRTNGWNIDSAGQVDLATASVASIAPGVDHTLALYFEGDLIEVYYDGVKVISTRDSGITAGQIGLDVSNQPIQFDNISVQPVVASVPNDEGPGGPVLVIGNKNNRFSRYLSEILDAEGIRYYRVVDISRVTAAVLAKYDVALMDEVSVSAAQVQMLTTWVQGGGNLIAMRPDRKLANLFGLQYASGSVAQGYIQILKATAIGAGLVTSTRLQFHGVADRIKLLAGSGSMNLATLFATASGGTTYSGLTLRSVGQNGGQASAFAYGLSRSVVQTRQGNPAWSGQDRDGQPPIRPDDLFFGNSAADPKADWIDFARIQIPQADEQQRLLRKLISYMNQDRKPLPSFWYLPRQLKAVVVMTGDDHASNGTSPRFDQYLALSSAGCVVNSWQCVRGTSYVFVNTPLSDTQAAAYTSQGFEVALHPNTSCQSATQPVLDLTFSTQLPLWKSQYPSLPAPVTNRNHCIAWANYASPAIDSLKYGIRLDTNYYYWPQSWVQDRPGLFTGSGFPMRFANADGTKIGVYQAATQITDESGINYSTHISTLLDNALGSKGYYAVVTANMHTDNAVSPGSDAITQAALARKVPIISAKQMLDWLDVRNGARFSGIQWATGNILKFQMQNVSTKVPGLRGMLPTAFGALRLSSLKRGGKNLAFSKMTVKGVEYAFFASSNASYEAQYQ